MKKNLTQGYTMPANSNQITEQAGASDGAFNTWSDETLVSYIAGKQNDSDLAFSILARRYHPWILRRCMFRLGNQHDAEDATQDIVMRVYASLHQFEGRSLFRTWLNTVINNYCNTYALRRSRLVTHDNIEQMIESSEQTHVTDPYEAYTEKELVRHVLDSLPEKARQVLNLRFYGECLLEEIADILCLTLSAAKARLYRAMESFKSIYNQLEGENTSRCLA